VPDEKRGRIEFKAFIDLPNATEDTDERDPQFLGEASKMWRAEQGKQTVFFEVTEQARAFVDNRHDNTITIVNASGVPVGWERLDLAFYADC